jgi:hypothetical protein
LGGQICSDEVVLGGEGRDKFVEFLGRVDYSWRMEEVVE